MMLATRVSYRAYHQHRKVINTSLNQPIQHPLHTKHIATHQIQLLLTVQHASKTTIRDWFVICSEADAGIKISPLRTFVICNHYLHHCNHHPPLQLSHQLASPYNVSTFTFLSSSKPPFSFPSVSPNLHSFTCNSYPYQILLTLFDTELRC